MNQQLCRDYARKIIMLKLCQDYAEIMPAASSAIAKKQKKAHEDAL